MSKPLTYGELCSGYGGLGLAVEEVFGAELKWYSEFDAAPSKIMAHHWPGIPNHGDMTAIDWAAVEPVDILSGGTPCQDLSAAGRRKGMTDGTRSNLWVHMREAIAVIKPKYVVWENVRGAYSASASSDLEQCPGCVGDTSDGRFFLRALGRVLGDLSDLGYDCQWRGLRAADVGGCHGRYRVFVLATHRDHIGSDRSGPRAEQDGRREPEGHRRVLANPRSQGLEVSRPGRLAPFQDPRATTVRDCAPAADSRGSTVWQHPGESFTEEAGQEGSHRSGDSHGERATGIGGKVVANGSGPAWHGSEQQHLPTPTGSAAELGELTGATAADPESIGRGEGRTESARLERGSDNALSSGTNWGEYEPAIRRHERVFGRTAPRPTEPTGRNGGHRLSPRFTEWMMGLADGWVTAPEIGLTRNEQLKACGDGVAPQQAAAALRDMTQHNKEGG